MTRYKAVVEYNGTGFVGWQSQPSGNTIQQTIEKSFLDIQLNKIKILDLDEPIQVYMLLAKYFILIMKKILIVKKFYLALIIS